MLQQNHDKKTLTLITWGFAYEGGYQSTIESYDSRHFSSFSTLHLASMDYREPQDETRNISVVVFDTTYIRDLTVIDCRSQRISAVGLPQEGPEYTEASSPGRSWCERYFFYSFNNTTSRNSRFLFLNSNDQFICKKMSRKSGTLDVIEPFKFVVLFIILWNIPLLITCMTCPVLPNKCSSIHIVWIYQVTRESPVLI